MKALGLLGSPRRRGNTELLLDELLRGAESEGIKTEKIVLCELKIDPCLECRYCETSGICVIEDEMQGIYPKLIEADLIILASPIFFYGVTTQSKALIDRCQALWARKYLLKQTLRKKRGSQKARGFFLSLGATKDPRLFEGATLTVKYFFDAIDAEYQGGLFYRQIENKGDILKHPTALKEAFDLGRGMKEKIKIKGSAPR